MSNYLMYTGSKKQKIIKGLGMFLDFAGPELTCLFDLMMMMNLFCTFIFTIKSRQSLCETMI
jgi:hypothetical protein